MFLICARSIFANQKVFYVSAKNGDDNYSGETLKKPWKDIHYAINRVTQICNRNNCDVDLFIDSGNYYVCGEISINGLNNKLRIKAIKEGSVKIHGDCLVENLEGNGKIKHVSLKGKNLGVAVGYSNRLDFYCNNIRQSLAGWPNGNYLKIDKTHGTTLLKSGNYKEPIFEYTEKEINKFANCKDVFAYGYWAYNWFDEYEKVDKIDTLTNTITLKECSPYGLKQGMRYRLLNLYSELDSAGEYYVDRSDSILYWFPSKGFNAKKDRLTITELNAKQMLSISNCNNVTIEGIVFSGGRNDGLLIKDCENITVYNCKFERFGNTGIKLQDSWNVNIKGCYLESLGGWGLNIKAGDIKNLISGNVTVSNCVFKGLSNYRDTYRQAIQFDGCGALIAHNIFEDHPSSALRINGNDVTIEYNVFDDLVKKSSDQGAIDIYNNYSYRGIVIRYNYWKNIDSKANVAAVRFDDIISGEAVYGNIFENCGNSYFGAIQIHGGNNNRVYGNLFLDCPCSVSFDKYDKNSFLKKLNEEAKDKNLGLFTTSIYKQKYQELNNPFDKGINKNFVYNNIIVNAKEPFRRSGNENIIQDNKLDSVPLNSKNKISHLLKQYKLKNIPFKEIGIGRNIYMHIK